MADYFSPTGVLASLIPGYEPREAQVQMAQAIADAIAEKDHLICESGTGCHAAGQGILMYDGSIRLVESIQAGDELMGSDGKPRLVIELRRGSQEMVDIVPVKGKPWRVNLDHVLTLVRTNRTKAKQRKDCKAGEVINVSVRQWLQWSKTMKPRYKLFRAPVPAFGSFIVNLPVRPYHLGMLLGDGSLSVGSLGVCKPDPEIYEACQVLAEDFGLRLRTREDKPGNPTHHLARQEVYGGRSLNALKTTLKQLGLWPIACQDKFIPQPYKLAATPDRRELLAGLLDTDGSLVSNGYDYISKSQRLADDVAFVARSLGLAAYVKPCEKYCQTGAGGTYFRVSISGNCDQIPCRIPRKQSHPRQQMKDALRTGFSVKSTGAVEPYYGFTLDGDGRYLLDDFTVTHNTGKSMSYLIALAASGTKALVSTHTKALQQQLLEQEIPRLQQVFPHVSAAVLKGRGSYACMLAMDRVDKGHQAHDLFSSPKAAKEYTQLMDWLSSPEGASGDLDQLPFGLSDEVHEKVTVDGYLCVGHKCPFLSRCYSQDAKIRAQAATLVIVNHHLLLLDLMLGKSVGLLPAHPVVVIDECHDLEETATSVFGAELTVGRWRVIERKLGALADHLQQRLSGTTFGELVLDRAMSVEAKANGVTATAEIWYQRLVEEMRDANVRTLDGLLHEALRQGGETLAQDTEDLQRTIERVSESLKSGPDEEDAIEAERWAKLANLCDRTSAWLRLAIGEADDEVTLPMVRYIERLTGRRRTSITLHVKPIRVSPLLERALWSERTVIATSATLATGPSPMRDGDAFTYWRDRVGAEGGRSLILPSPFPFRVSTRLYVPSDPQAFDPTKFPWKERDAQEQYRQRIVQEILALLAVRRGGAFVLCTSALMMRMVAEALRVSGPDTIYVQGEAPPAALVRQFRDHGRAVLVGTKTFWQGIDIPGDALSLVIIDRLPFGVPDDPLWDARCKEVGEAWFSELALPTTLLALKQGVGRLIRRMDDVGVMAILDSRLRSKSYGKWLLKGLPPAPLIGDLKDVERFFTKLEGDR